MASRSPEKSEPSSRRLPWKSCFPGVQDSERWGWWNCEDEIKCSALRLISGPVKPCELIFDPVSIVGIKSNDSAVALVGPVPVFFKPGVPLSGTSTYWK